MISDRFMIHKSQIFYLQEKSVMMNGILDMEELSEIPDIKDSMINRRFSSGPFMMDGCE